MVKTFKNSTVLKYFTILKLKCFSFLMLPVSCCAILSLWYLKNLAKSLYTVAFSEGL